MHKKSSQQRDKQQKDKQYKKRFCYFCKNKRATINYKDVDALKRFLSEKGKIRARRITGNCAQHQHKVANAIKRARQMALMPYSRKQQ